MTDVASIRRRWLAMEHVPSDVGRLLEVIEATEATETRLAEAERLLGEFLKEHDVGGWCLVCTPARAFLAAEAPKP